MSLEAETIEKQAHGPVHAEERRARTERRGRDRRRVNSRINRQAPRRSTLQALGVNAIGGSAAVIAIIALAGEFILSDMPWGPLGVAGVVFGFAVLAFMMGCVEQRLIEIRLELMMLNGGSRQGDRREHDRRDQASASEPRAYGHRTTDMPVG